VESTTLFCLKDVCVSDVTIPSGAVWTGTAPGLVVPVTRSLWSTPTTATRALAIGTALYEPLAGVPWRNEGPIAARLIAFTVRP
jgi:hypothetical protein